MRSHQILDYETYTMTGAVFSETRRFLWWTWTTFRWVSYHYHPGEIRAFKVIRGYSPDAAQAIVAAKMEVHRS